MALFTYALAIASCLLPSTAQYSGFNYGALNPDGTPTPRAQYETLFTTAKQLSGSAGRFTSARLYTMVQAGTANSIIEAIPAAIDTDTSLLLGMWASAGQGAFDNELAALTAAIELYPSLAGRIAGLSIGSEDLYRITPTGIQNNAGIGAGPDVLERYITQARNVLRGTAWSTVLVGHVDTWTAYVNASNAGLIRACDWIGVDAYPYFQYNQSNSVENGAALFDAAYQVTVDAAQGKPVWITETGWPCSGPQSGDAVASIDNAKTYWDTSVCKYLGTTNMWYYTLWDGTPSPSFGLTGNDLTTRPLFPLNCSVSSSTSSAVTSTLNSSTSSESSTTAITSSSTSYLDSSSIATSVSTDTLSSTDSTVTFTASNSASTSICSTCTATSSLVTIPEPTDACRPDTLGIYEFPHLIIPIDSQNPDTAAGPSYNGTISPTVSSVFNFDIPAQYACRTCSLVFLLPDQQDATFSYDLSGTGGLVFELLSEPVTVSTTWNTCPRTAAVAGSITTLTPGSSYSINTGACWGGSRIAYRVSATGTVDLDYFQNSADTPIGLYIKLC